MKESEAEHIDIKPKYDLYNMEYQYFLNIFLMI